MKKKWIAFLMAIGILILSGTALADEYAIVTNGQLNLRQQATSSSPSLGRYSGGTWIRILGMQNNGWLPVATPDGKTGYMYSTYLTFVNSKRTATVRYANGGYVNLRSGPSLDYSVITRVTSGSTISILNDSYEWYLVSANVYGMEYQGYMHESLINRGTQNAVVTTRNGGRVNVRSGPSFSYGSIGSLASGTTVNVLLKGKDWYWISGGGLTGFMSTSYLSGTGSTIGYNTGGSFQVSTTTAYVNNPKGTQILNLREYATQESRSLGQYRNGTKVRVVNRGSTWCEVYVGTKHGYMMTRYLSFNGKYVPPTTRSSSSSSHSRSSSATAVPQFYDYQAGAQMTPVPTATPYYQVYATAVPTATPYYPVYATAVPTAVPVYQTNGTAIPVYSAPQTQATPVPAPALRQTAAPAAVQPTAAPVQPAAGKSSAAASVQVVTFKAADPTKAEVAFFNDAALAVKKGTYPVGKTAKMLSYGEKTCLLLVDGVVGYVATEDIEIPQ